jgi:hypothetical protein
MLCIKKNKCFSTVLLLSQKNRQHTVIRSDLLKHVWTCRNTFQSVQINPFEPVETRFNPFRSVQTRFQASPPPLPPPPTPFSPFFGGGRGREGGETIAITGPRKGEGGDEVPPPPPLRILTTTTTKNKILALFLLQIFKICVIYPYPLKVSLSPLLLKTT